MSNLNRIFHALQVHHHFVAKRDGLKRLTRRQLKRMAVETARLYPGFHSVGGDHV